MAPARELGVIAPDSLNKPRSWHTKGRYVLKNPDRQVNGQIKRVKPVALVQATTLCSNSPVNLVCLGMKTTACLTFALALEIEVPMVKRLRDRKSVV